MEPSGRFFFRFPERAVFHFDFGLISVKKRRDFV